jgi:hypothetical protein
MRAILFLSVVSRKQEDKAFPSEFIVVEVSRCFGHAQSQQSNLRTIEAVYKQSGAQSAFFFLSP